jgi:sugar lactone lactonase YvrE
MKRFIQMGLLLAIVLLTASVSRSQVIQTFQTGDVFISTGCFGECDAQVLWYRANGTFVRSLDTGQSNTDAVGMAFDVSGNLYVTIFQGRNVVKFDHTGTLVGTFGSGEFSYSYGVESIRFDLAGNAYVGQAGVEGVCSNTCPVLKFDPLGNILAAYFAAPEGRGTDWIDIAADQKTLFYTSEGTHVKRFDTSTNTQLADFASGLPGTYAYAIRILPDGGVLVADSDRVVRLDSSGNVIRTYLALTLEEVATPQLFALSLDPDGKSFWTGDLNGTEVWKVDLATGTLEQTISISDPTVDGVVIFHEITATNSVNLVFSPSATPETQIATIGKPNDPSAQSLALTLSSVADPPGMGINVSVSFFYEPTDVSTGTQGNGIADGDCESGATEATDFDCRLTPFTYPAPLLPAGDALVPHIIPSHNDLGVWVRVIATRVSDGQPAVAGVDYGFNVDWFYAWNSNPRLTNPTPNPAYLPGWNNLNPQMYDRPGENVDPAFVANISTFTKDCATMSCVGSADPGKGGRTKTLNDIVIAAPPNPPSGGLDTVELLVPEQRRAPFQYLKSLPMLVSFELENEKKEKSDPTALTPPHSVNVSTVDQKGNPIDVQYPAGAPTTFTYNPVLNVYFILLSPAPYKTDGTVYTMQINSDLFPQPVVVKFVVKKSLF